MTLINNRFFSDPVVPPYVPRDDGAIAKIEPRPTWLAASDAAEPEAVHEEAREQQHQQPAPESQEPPTMIRPEILDLFETAHREYVGLLVDSFPAGPGKGTGPEADFGPARLCELALRAQAAAIALGPTALARLSFLGLELLYPFDNPVDMYHWRAHVRDQDIGISMFSAIALRIESELKRMRLLAEMEALAAYATLPTSLLLVSKERYAPGALAREAELEAQAEEDLTGPEVDAAAMLAVERTGTAFKKPLVPATPLAASKPESAAASAGSDAFIPAGALRI